MCIISSCKISTICRCLTFRTTKKLITFLVLSSFDNRSSLLAGIADHLLGKFQESRTMLKGFFHTGRSLSTTSKTTLAAYPTTNRLYVVSPQFSNGFLYCTTTRRNMGLEQTRLIQVGSASRDSMNKIFC